MHPSWFNRFSRSGFFLVLAGIVFILILVSLGREVGRNRNIAKQIAALEKQARELEGRNTELLEIQDKLKDPEFVEREARTRFGLQKPGESVVVVRVPSSSNEKPATVLLRLSNVRAWWLYFFSHDEYKNL